LDEIQELDGKKREGWNTRRGSPRGHIYKVHISGKKYFKFHLKRDNKSTIVYFNKKKDAVAFRDTVKETKSLRLSVTKMNKRNSLRSLDETEQA
jgi:hypothetical protein